VPDPCPTQAHPWEEAGLEVREEVAAWGNSYTLFILQNILVLKIEVGPQKSNHRDLSLLNPDIVQGLIRIGANIWKTLLQLLK
jgi:hypothetical protein